MRYAPKEVTSPASNAHLLLAYVADLELEVDRLRRHSQFARHEVRETVKRIRIRCADDPQAGDAPSRPSDAGSPAGLALPACRDHRPDRASPTRRPRFIRYRKGGSPVDNDSLTFGQPHLRGADSNSLLRMYDAAKGIVNTSPFRQERARAGRAVRRLAKELQKRHIPL
jgi:hypothetical protein